MSCPGLHCAGCGGGAAVPVAGLAAVFGVAWVAENIVMVAAVSAACAVLSLAAVAVLMRQSRRRDARRLPLWTARELPAMPAPRIAQAPTPAIEQHVHYHYHAAPDVPARITGGNDHGAARELGRHGADSADRLLHPDPGVRDPGQVTWPATPGSSPAR